MSGRSWLIGLAAVSVSLCVASGVRAVPPMDTPTSTSADAGERASARLARWRGGDFLPCALFDEGTDPAYVEEVTARMVELWRGGGLERFNLDDPWFGGAGVAGALTYSFPPDGINISDGIGEGSAPNVLHATLTLQFGSEQAWKDIFRQVFDRWSEITGMEYIEVPDDGATWGLSGSANRGDIRIVMKQIDGPGGVLAYNQFPTNGDMVLDRSESYSNSANNFRRFRNIISHEHGHGLGLRHVCPVNSSKLMEPFVSTIFDGPQHDDIRGSQFFYGDPNEPNESFDQHTTLGAVQRGQTLTITDLSLRDDGDVDFYSFAVPDNAIVSISVTPDGFEYLQDRQNLDGTCPTGEPFDSASRIDLGLELILPDGQTTLREQVGGGLGEPEAISELPLENVLPAVFYARVSAEDLVGGAQLYRLAISVAETSAECDGDLNGDGVVGAQDMATLLGGWGQNEHDLNGDGVVTAADLAKLLGFWGPCS